MIGSLLVTEIILQVVGLQLSVAATSKRTGVIRLFIGRRIGGVAVRPVIAGDSVSCTVTSKLQVAVVPDASVAVQVTVVVPAGKTAPAGGMQTTTTLPVPPLTRGAG